MEFKIRCSAINDIMADGKGSPISVGAKTFCKKWLKEQMFSRRDIVSTKYMDKGNETEEEALNLLTRVLKLPMIYKNTEKREDEFKTGECDFICDGIIYDNKSSFSLDTFPLFEDKLDPKYHDQMLGYESLWGIIKGKVCYTLNNTPIDILRGEIKWLQTDDEKQQKALNHVFTEAYWNQVKETLFPNAKKIDFKPIPDKYRVKVFDVNFDSDRINKCHIKVIGCRDYTNELYEKIK